MQIIGIIAGLVIGGIVIMVLLNKLLDYLSDRFPIGYNVVNILFFGVAFILAFVYWGADEGSRLSSGVMCGVMHFISLYLLFTDVEEENFTINKVESHYQPHFFSDDEWVTTETEEEGWRPAFWVKLLMVMGTLGVACALTFFINLAWIAFLLEIAMPVWLIILEIRRRRRR